MEASSSINHNIEKDQTHEKDNFQTPDYIFDAAVLSHREKVDEQHDEQKYADPDCWTGAYTCRPLECCCWISDVLEVVGIELELEKPSNGENLGRGESAPCKPLENQLVSHLDATVTKTHHVIHPVAMPMDSSTKRRVNSNVGPFTGNTRGDKESDDAKNDQW